MEDKYGMSFESFLKNFKQHVSKLGLKNSIQKDYILKILFFCDEHLTAEEITYKVKDDYKIEVGIATVYRAMKFFEDMGIVDSLDVGDGIKRYEINLSLHHDHLVCTQCHKIIEFADDLIELNQIKVAESNNFVLKNHIMTIYGICEDCQ